MVTVFTDVRRYDDEDDGDDEVKLKQVIMQFRKYEGMIEQTQYTMS